MKAEATKRVMAMATRVASKNEDGNDGSGKSNGNCNKAGRHVTAKRAMAVATTVVGNDEGDGNGVEGGGQQRG